MRDFHVSKTRKALWHKGWLSREASSFGADGAFEEAKTYQPVYKNGTLTWVELSSTTVEGLQALIEDLRTDVDALDDKIGEVTVGKTVVQMIEDAKTAATHDDTEVLAKIYITISDDTVEMAVLF